MSGTTRWPREKAAAPPPRSGRMSRGSSASPGSPNPHQLRRDGAAGGAGARAGQRSDDSDSGHVRSPASRCRLSSRGHRNGIDRCPAPAAPFVNPVATDYRRLPNCGRPRYQCSPSFEPSAAAVMIAGMPIAIVASARARASIMTIPLENGRAPRTSDQQLKKPFPRSDLSRICFRRISPHRFLFRGLWQ